MKKHILLWALISWICLIKIAWLWSMNFIIFSSMYMYALRKRYNDFKGSQMAMNESLREGRHPELASTWNMALPAGIKLAHELRTLSIKKHGPVTGIIVTLARISVSNILKHDMNTWWKWFTIHNYEIYMIYACMMSL